MFNNPNPLNLLKGDILDLTKEYPSLHNIIVGCGWDVNVDGDNFDLDLSAFLLNKNGRVIDPRQHVVYFRQMRQNGISLNGDNQTGSGNDGEDDEQISIQLDEVDRDIDSIVFNVNIYDCKNKRQTFGLVKNSYIRLLDSDNNDKELCRFELRKNASSSTAVTFAKLFRTENGWLFKALGESLVVDDLNKLLLRYM